jgi:phosphate starvation-inducible PhoH-like protein
MAESQTLQFENARAVQQLYGGELKLLKNLEEELNVRITTREGWVRIEGETENIDRAKRVFEQLERARQSGMPIRRHEFNYALRSVVEPPEAGEGPGHQLHELLDTKLATSPRRAPIIPKTATQRNYVHAIQNTDLVFGIGPAGTGKTYLAMAMALVALKKEEVNRIILTRPAVEAGEALGFLPGDLKEKIAPYLRPLYDALQDMLDDDERERYVEKNIIEIAPLAYMRGRTLNHAFIILDEAQNTTTEQMLMFLTRLGSDSKCVITGDTTQIDLPSNKRSGLIEALQALKDVRNIAFCSFEERDVVRHELVRQIVRAYKRHRSGDVGSRQDR